MNQNNQSDSFDLQAYCLDNYSQPILCQQSSKSYFSQITNNNNIDSLLITATHHKIPSFQQKDNRKQQLPQKNNHQLVKQNDASCCTFRQTGTFNKTAQNIQNQIDIYNYLGLGEQSHKSEDSSNIEQLSSSYKQNEVEMDRSLQGNQNVKDLIVAENIYLKERNKCLQTELLKLKMNLTERMTKLQKQRVRQQRKNQPKSKNEEGFPVQYLLGRLQKSFILIKNLQNQLQYLYQINTKLINKLTSAVQSLKNQQILIKKHQDQKIKLKQQIQQQLQYNSKNIKRILQLQDILMDRRKHTNFQSERLDIQNQVYNKSDQTHDKNDLNELQLQRLRDKNERYRLKINRITKQKQHMQEQLKFFKETTTHYIPSKDTNNDI